MCLDFELMLVFRLQRSLKGINLWFDPFQNVAVMLIGYFAGYNSAAAIGAMLVFFAFVGTLSLVGLAPGMAVAQSAGKSEGRIAGAALPTAQAKPGAGA